MNADDIHTYAQVLAARDRLALLRRTATGLVLLGQDKVAAPLFRESAELAQLRPAIDWPCMLCGVTRREMELAIDDDAQPGSLVCGQCSADIDVQIAAMADERGHVAIGKTTCSCLQKFVSPEKLAEHLERRRLAAERAAAKGRKPS